MIHPQPKPERRSTVKRRAERKQRLSRAQCRAVVFRNAEGKCQRCGRPVTDDCPPYLPQRAHVHEKVLRSLGGSPYDPANCELLCNFCHMPGGSHAPNMERLLMILKRMKARQGNRRRA